MGSAFSKNKHDNSNSSINAVSNPNRNSKSCNLISQTIYDIICSVPGLVPGLACICMEFIGYDFQSFICTEKQRWQLYNMMMTHHTKKQMSSPVLYTSYICHFQRLYHASNAEINHFSSYFQSQCIGKPNLLILFQTSFDHLFAFYINSPIKPIPEETRTLSKYFPLSYDDCGLYLIQSQFGSQCSKKCPRIVEESNTPPDQWVFAIVGKDFCIGDLFLCFMYDNFVCSTSNLQRYDTLGNELVGGTAFNPNPDRYSVGFKQIEVFQIL
eukprot:19265_1